jgi:imidazoleglycerol-phosphate dehydratase
MSRKAEFERKTKETEISISLDIDGKGVKDIRTPIAFLSHMLGTLAGHGRFDIRMRAQGDINVDQHHLVEDCGLCLGEAFRLALADFRGIHRAGYFMIPMDESLALSAVDLGGRPFLQFKAAFNRRFCGELDTDLVEDFFRAFAVRLGANVAVRVLSGRSDHHKLEAVFKAFGRALRQACAIDDRAPEDIPSLKGVIDHDWNR